MRMVTRRPKIGGWEEVDMLIPGRFRNATIGKYTLEGRVDVGDVGDEEKGEEGEEEAKDWD